MIELQADDLSFSLQDLSGFIDRMIQEGLMNRVTAQARHYACQLILGDLPGDLLDDVGNIDLEQAYRRFIMSCDARISVETLETYRLRMKRAVKEMKRWRQNPEAFERDLRKRTATKAERHMRAVRHMGDIPPLPDTLRIIPGSTLPAVPVALREGVVVQILGLPYDLTPQEAQRIQKVVEAYIE